MTYIEQEDKVTKWMFWLMGVPAMILLFVVLSQPAWNGKKMLAQLKTDCAKQHGVLLDDKGMFGDTYSCAPRLDR